MKTTALLLLAALPALAGSVTLAWNKSPQPSVNRYNLYYGPSSQNFTNKLTGIVGTNATVQGLATGSIYVFALTCVDTNGIESLPSTAVAFKIPFAPFPVVNLNVTN